MKSHVLRRLALVVVGVALGVGALATVGFGKPAPSDAITAARFSLTIDTFEIASFSELKGITAEVEPVEYLSSDDREVILNKLPGKLTPPTVVLSGPMTSDLTMWAWHEAARQGNMAQARKSVSLIVYNAQGTAVARYWLEKAWPSKIAVTTVDAGAAGQSLVQTVTLVAEYMQRVAP